MGNKLRQKEIVIGTGTIRKSNEKSRKFIRTLTMDKRGEVTISWIPVEKTNGKVLDGRTAGKM